MLSGLITRPHRRSGTHVSILLGASLLLVALFAASAHAHSGHPHVVYGPPAPAWAWGKDAEAQRAAARANNAYGAQAFKTRLEDAPVERGGTCVATTEFPGIGEGCRTSDGLLRVQLEGDASIVTHGPDFIESVTDTDPTSMPARMVAAVQGATRDDIACVPASERHIQLVYAIHADGVDRSADRSEAFRQSIYEASAVIDNEARSLDPTAGRQIKVLCDGNGDAQVTALRLATRRVDADFYSVIADLHARQGSIAGAGMARAVVFYDDDLGSYAGIAQMYSDDTASLTNPNNLGGRVALHDNTEGDAAPSWKVMLHEISHNMGAVQYAMPGANGVGHCNDGRDVMCYAESGSGTYSDSVCALMQYDCNHDSYFHPNPSPGSALATKWNVGSTTNGFLHAFDATPDTSAPSAPTGVNGVGHGSFIRLSWNAATDTGSGVHGYRVYLSSQGSWLPVGDSWAGETTIDVAWSGIAQATSYSLRVVAFDERGNEGSPAMISVGSGSTGTATRTAGGPMLLPPADVHVMSSTSTNVTIAWEARDPSSRTYYRLERLNPTNGCWCAWITTWKHSATFAAPTANSRHQYRIRSIDEQGRSSAWVEVAGWTQTPPDQTPPDAPANLRVTSSAGTAPTIAWDAPPEAVSYVISRQIAGTWTQVDSTTQLTRTIRGLPYASTTTIRVAARDEAGNVSTPGVVSHATGAAPDRTAPTKPAMTSFSPVTKTSITVGWDAATDNVGVVGYRLLVASSRDGIYRVAATTTTTRTAAATGLRPGTEHRIMVQAVDAAGYGSPTNSYAIVSTASDTANPSDPTALAVSNVGTTTATLSWNASTDDSGIAGYRVLRDGTYITTTTKTTYTFTGLAPSTSYALSVQAVDVADKTSAPAALTTTTSSAGDTTPPSTPGGFAVGAVTDSSVELNWSSSSDDVGVTQYIVRRAAPDPSETSVATLGAGDSSTTITGLRPETSYVFTIAAIDAAGNESARATASAATLAPADTTPPTSPGTISVEGTTGTSVSLTWIAASDEVAVTGYRIYRSAPNASGSPIATTTGTSHSISGLSSGVSYTFSITARDAAGNESSSRSVTVATQDVVDPTPPTSLRAQAASESTVVLAWDAATDNVGVAGYRVLRSVAGVASVVGTTPTLSFEVTGLTAATSYRFQVEALDAADRASSRATIDVTTPDETAPTSPEQLLSTSFSDTAISLTWAVSSDAVGVTGYRIYRTAPTASGAPIASTDGARSTTIGGLQVDTEYTFTVTAVDAAGNESTPRALTTRTAAVPDTDAPTAPGSLSVSDVGLNDATLSWSSSSDANGISGYRVERTDAGSGQWLLIATATGTSYGVDGLAAGSGSSWRVRAIDASGNISAASSTVTITTTSPADATPPTQPGAQVSSSATSTGTAGLAWPASSDASGVAGYRVYLYSDTGWVLIGTTTATSLTITGLPLGQVVRIGIGAFDAAGNESAKTMTYVDVPAPPRPAPSAPTNLSAVASSTQVTASWDQLPGITYRVIAVNEGGGVIAQRDIIGGSTTFGSLARNIQLTIQVFAIGIDGTSAAAVVVARTVALRSDTARPTRPGRVRAKAMRAGRAKLSWRASRDNVRVARYEVRIATRGARTIKLRATGRATSLTIKRLGRRKAYIVRMRAVDTSGNASAWVKTRLRSR